MPRNNFKYIGVVFAIGIVMLASGCMRSAEKAKDTVDVQDEVVTPPTESVSPASEGSEGMEETSIGKETDMMSESLSELADVYFDFDRYGIRQESRAGLEAAAEWLKSNSNIRVQISGYCDERGTNDYNLTLGERRANAVKDFLSALGVDVSRLSTISYGEERPLCNETNETCYSKNRRAHFSIQ